MNPIFIFSKVSWLTKLIVYFGFWQKKDNKSMPKRKEGEGRESEVDKVCELLLKATKVVVVTGELAVSVVESLGV
jgi:hypothetical protein